MAAFGAFGKIPALGDFFRIGQLPGFVQPWDAWIQTGIAAARQSLGTQWTACYMSAPIWRFTLSAGLAGPETVQGVLMPSVDRVGRQFPLTLAAQIPGAPQALVRHLLSTPVFSALEDIALAALAETTTRQDLSTALAGCALPDILPGPDVLQSGRFVAVPAGHAPTERLAAHLAQARFAAPSIWSTDPDRDGRLMIVEGLPGPAMMQALMDPDAQVWRAPAIQGDSV